MRKYKSPRTVAQLPLTELIHTKESAYKKPS
jgi:hypothetical protein